MEKIQNDINQVTQLVKENFCKLDTHYHACTGLLTAAEDLNSKSRQFSRLSKKIKWWKNNQETIQLVLISISIIILLILLIVLLDIPYRS